MAARIATGFKAFFITLFIVGWVGFLFAMVIAQEIPTGSVEGLVVHRDKEVYKGLVAGATVILSSEDVLMRTTTDEQGKYKLGDVPVGGYVIEVTALGLVDRGYRGVEVHEGKTSKAEPVVMATRPPDISASFGTSVFVPGEKVLMNVRGYSRDDTHARISLHRLDIRGLLLARNRREYGRKAWEFADPNPITEWDQPLKKDAEGFFRTQVTIPVDGEGSYLVRTSMGKLVRDSWFTVSRLALVTKGSKSKLLAYCVDFETRKPVEGVAVTVYWGGREAASGVTGPHGLYTGPPVEESSLVIAEKGDSLASTYAYYYGGAALYSCLMYTDRPVYRPGHRVHFKGILRLRWNNFYRVPPATAVTVVIMEPSGRELKRLLTSTNEFGSFNGDFELNSEAPLGSYRIEAYVGGREFGAEFEVAEYRKPEFKVSLSFDRKYFIAGTRIKGTVEASYYFGAPAANADVEYTVFRSRGYYCWGYFGEEFYEEFESSYFEESYGYGELVTEGKGRTDSSGRFRLEIPTERGKEDATYQVEVNVTDQSLRTIGASGSVFVPVGLFRLRAWTDEYIYRPDEPVEIRIRAVDYEDRPRGDVAVEVRVDEERWEVRTRRFRRVTSGEVTTKADGSAVFRFTPPKEGYYRVRVQARDRLDNLITGSAWVWVAGDEFAMEAYRGPTLEIVRDKKVYEVGDTARIMINSSVKGVYALLTVEGQDLFLHRILYLKNNNTMVNLKALERYVPNAFISVCFVDGKNFVSNQVPFNVSPEYKFLNVSVKSDKEVYHPGDTARYTIRTTDTDGRPVSAEVSLGIVDESIYAIMEDRTPEIRRFFYGPRGNSVSTSHSFPGYYMGGADKEAFAGRVRKYFPDTAFWSPDVVTDSRGRATITMKVPDSLTTWRATARAVTRDTDVGWKTQTVRATKDLIVRLQTPRFFTQRDELSIGAALHNYTDTRQKVRLWLKVEGLDLQGELKRTVTISPDQIMRFEWPVKAVKAGTAVLTVYAQGQTDSDAMELEVPVLPHGLDRIATANGSVDREDEIRFDVPSTAIPETVEMEVRITPTAAGTMLGSLDYLAQYPYGCVEQTMSKLLPTMIVAEVVRSLGRPYPELEKRLPGMVSTGLQRLYNFQNADGGWGWWEDESSPFTTAYVIYGMTHARKAGYQVDEGAFWRGIGSLQSQVARFYGALQIETPDVPPFADPTERVYMLYALALNGRADARHVEDIYKDRRKMTAYGNSILALTLYEMGDREKADRVAGELERESKYFKGMRHWDVDETEWRWQDSSIEATAYGLRALVRRDPQDPKLEEIVRWLTMKRTRNRWRSTKDTAAAVYALAEYVRARPDLEKPSYSADVYLNGRKQKTISVTWDDVFSKEIAIPLARDDSRVGRNSIVIRKSGTGPLYYSAVLRYYSLEEDIKAYTSGIKVKREYFRLVAVKQPNGEMRLQPRPIGERVRIPEQILCRLTIDSNDNYHYVVIEDPRPAGWESIEQLSDVGYYGWHGEEEEEGGWAPWTRREFRDEKVVIFATRLPKGKWVTEYRLRAEIPGEFHSLPTTAYGMYAPQVNGNAAEKRVRVR